MTFINTDGMAFIGPGSEWFWTALSGIVLAVTFIAIYRQLRLQRSQTSIEQLSAFQREWRAEPILRAKVGLLAALRDGADRASVPNEPAETIAMFWEQVGYLARAGHLDAKLLWNGGDGVQVAFWWTLLAPWIGTQRALPGGSAWTFENFEWVARTMAALSRGAGHPALDDATYMDAVPEILALNQDRLAVAVALRTVILALPEAAPALTAAAAQD